MQQRRDAILIYRGQGVYFVAKNGIGDVVKKCLCPCFVVLHQGKGLLVVPGITELSLFDGGAGKAFFIVFFRHLPIRHCIKTKQTKKPLAAASKVRIRASAEVVSSAVNLSTIKAYPGGHNMARPPRKCTCR
jgi:hypothetical protein